METKTKNTPAQVSELDKIKQVAAKEPRIIVAESRNVVSTKDDALKSIVERPAPESKLKPTPDILTDSQRALLAANEARQQLEAKMAKARELDRLTRGYHKLEHAASMLASFEVNDGDEHTEEEYNKAMISIMDSKRKEYKISNPVLINAVLVCLHGKIEKRKGEILDQIKNFTLDSI